MGDGILALFPGSPEDGLRAGIEMGEAVAAYNVERTAHGRQPISVGTGIHTGSLMLGIVGERERMQGTVISDAVNLASRLESLSKRYNASILVSEQLFGQIPDLSKYCYRFIERVRVKGKREPVSVFQFFDGEPAEGCALKMKTRPDFDSGIGLYQDRQFAEAEARFAAVLAVDPDDRAAALYHERAGRYARAGVADDWTAVADMRDK